MKLSIFYEHLAEAVRQENKTGAEICKEARKCGIDYVELDYDRYVAEGNKLEEVLKQAGLQVSCIYRRMDFAYSLEADLALGYELIDTAVKLNCKRVLVIPGLLKEEDLGSAMATQEICEQMAAGLRKLCAYARENDITVCMEDYDDIHSPYATMNGLLWFMQQVEGLSCAFDTGNFLYVEEDATDAIRVLLPYIAHVHCKDRTFEEHEKEVPKTTVAGRDMYAVAVGSGCIPMTGLIAVLRNNDYDGIYAIEHFGSIRQLADMRESATYLKRVLS